jgi:transcriptional regulator with XRE-family HTH domain
LENSLKKSLIAAVKSLNLKFPVSDISKKTGYSKGNISEYLKIENKKEPSRAFLLSLCEHYGLVFNDWFDLERLRDTVRAVPEEAFMEVPVLVRESGAGYRSAAGDKKFVETLPTMLVPREYEKGNYLVIELVGESMNDGTDRSLLDGDKLLTKEEPLDRANIGKLPIKKHLFVIATKGEDPVAKQILSIDMEKGMLMCHSWNSEFEDYPIFLEDITRILKVKKLVERPIRL